MNIPSRFLKIGKNQELLYIHPTWARFIASQYPHWIVYHNEYDRTTFMYVKPGFAYDVAEHIFFELA